MAMIGSPSSFPATSLYPVSQQNRYPQGSGGFDPLKLSPLPELLKPADLYKPMATSTPSIAPFTQSFQPPLSSPPLSPPLSQSLQSFNRPSGLASVATRTPFSPLTNLPAANSSALGVSGLSAASSPFNTASRLQGPSPFAQPLRPFGSPMPALARPGFSPAVNNLAANAVPSVAEELSPAEETGEKIKKIVVALLEDNPALQEKVQQQVEQIDMDAIEENVGPKVEAFRSSVQPGISKVPMPVVRRVINAMCGDDPASKQLATEFVEWLRKPPEAALAEGTANRPGSRTNGGRRTDDPFAEDPMGSEEDSFAAEEDLPEAQPPKKSMMDNLKSKVWPFNKESDKENIDPAPKRRSTPQKRRMSDEELDAMLNDSFGNPEPRPARKRPRPMLEDDVY